MKNFAQVLSIEQVPYLVHRVSGTLFFPLVKFIVGDFPLIMKGPFSVGGTILPLKNQNSENLYITLFGRLNFSTITEGSFIIHAQYNCNTGVPN